MRTCVLTRGVSSIRVFHRALGGASSEMRIRRHAAFSFVRLRGVFGRKRTKEE